MNQTCKAFPTMITPYHEDGSVDYETVKKYVHWYHDQGCHGIFAICQSSEIFWLSDEEIVKINRTVYDTVEEIARNGGRRMTVVSSGHIYDDAEAQAKLFCNIAQSGTDALVLITNHFDPQNEGDDVFLKNAEAFLKKLPADAKLGLYECPYPYKRLLTPRILQWALDTDRFYFIKDTCCDNALLKERGQMLKGSHLGLYNANCQTLLSSLQNDCAGYSGIMCNYHPKLYAWLCENFQKAPEQAEMVQEFLCMSGFTENGLPYPLSAKYHMNLCGIPTVNYARHVDPARLTDYTRDCMRQMKQASDRLEAYLGI